MEKFISLASDPDFQPFQWSWPGNHQPMHATMIMLIDLYERPYSPEAPKSRAFIDRIFSLSGPDGGVVGGEDGVSTQRPLKDGGREAWDMIRRLRQKAWEKSGLDPQRLWTEKAQIQAGVVPSQDEHGEPSLPGSPKASSSRQPVTDQQLTNFSKTFHEMTRNNTFPRPSRLRYQLPPPVPTGVPTSPQTLSNPQLHNSASTSSRPLDTTLASSTISSPEGFSQLHSARPFAQSQPPPQAQHHQPQTQAPIATTATPPAPLPFMDTFSPGAQPMAVPTPPSMVDPNLGTFDWDQWDAVFGQHLPVADELMELDPVVGFEFADLGGGGRPGPGDQDAAMGGGGSGNWIGYG